MENGVSIAATEEASCSSSETFTYLNSYITAYFGQRVHPRKQNRSRYRVVLVKSYLST